MNDTLSLVINPFGHKWRFGRRTRRAAFSVGHGVNARVKICGLRRVSAKRVSKRGVKITASSHHFGRRAVYPKHYIVSTSSAFGKNIQEEEKRPETSGTVFLPRTLVHTLAPPSPHVHVLGAATGQQGYAARARRARGQAA